MDFKRMLIESLEVPEAVPSRNCGDIGYNVGVAKRKSENHRRKFMRQYELKERKEISKIICNKCGKEIPVSGGHEMKGVFRVDYEWGYFSEKRRRETCL